ncbi:NADP-dependent oxidoreductase [Burkholderia pseudomallei]|uniref:NADP-dependent oxidoreductase n=1 Tax=Burkholderia pseudomallei TaxID=28450 RepID=UPI001A0A144B|nr:NADP-dependent oxidoreductase [Burkholderia pseudomallei]MBF3528049.1 NADP-dependent oxidoreductase [Burkholderia pseudomallei]MBF3926898.1 NADP-dependent oxidoreductase [Burkholderia pseudomallei]MBF3989435.1 NADP-dependent oxidoreductase [Burkholderia pseudomallei]MBF4005395.1 NADP-dependent oxidoreductase [Burkholderia pseudomallei]MCW0024431.1 NADP-dependent oxidoreductase [Burkholderia pseudomallei]
MRGLTSRVRRRRHFRAPPAKLEKSRRCDCIVADRGSRIADRGSRIADRGSRIADRGSRIADRGSRIADRASRLAPRASRLAPRASRLAPRASRECDRGALAAFADAGACRPFPFLPKVMPMSTPVNRQLRLKARPDGRVGHEHFTLAEAPLPALGPGEMLVRVLYLSMDPTNRVWMSDIPQYLPPVAIGDVMRALGIGRVVASNAPGFAEGDLVQGLVGWQDYAHVRADEIAQYTKLPAALGLPLPRLLGACGMSGLTAYYGLTEIAPVQPGETLVVSAAAGSVGSVAGQIGKIHGARVVGIAGGADKCRYLTDELGFDAAVDYKSDDWKRALKDATPDGVHVSFENVGGEIMRAVLSRMAIGGRVALCGVIANYNNGRPADDVSVLIAKRLTMRGFLILDYRKSREAIATLAGWLRDGRLKAEETVADGLTNAPDVLNRLFDGSHRGKLVLRVDPQA